MKIRAAGEALALPSYSTPEKTKSANYINTLRPERLHGCVGHETVSFTNSQGGET
ncbi:MAG TPA: hypothetical protein VHC42_02795 [Rhizomicrobium sp.]|jgi:hypothetical protein|nr:hypothetical protein [Rhizomicrobium sp.]